MMAVRRRLVLTLDAFGTLFKPIEPISRQYVEVARLHGLKDITEVEIGQNFKEAFRKAQSDYPNYGKNVGMGAVKWWSNVIQATLRPDRTGPPLPPRLVSDLLQRFATAEAYNLYPDVHEFFRSIRPLKDGKSALSYTDVLVGVITNSDDRVPLILTSLGLQVGSHRFPCKSNSPDAIRMEKNDIDFCVMSYDVGVEKPNPRIFDAAKETACSILGGRLSNDIFIHVGDELKKDYLAATNAGWRGVYLGGHGRSGEKGDDTHVLFIEDLRDLKPYLLKAEGP